MPGLLDRLERYYDALPRSFGARAEQIGPLTLFVYDAGPWPLYARPSLGMTEISPPDVTAVRARMRDLGVPEAFEWVEETTPALRPAAVRAGLAVSDHPMLVLTSAPNRPAAVAEVRRVSVDDDMPPVLAAAALGFDQPGTAVGPVGLAELAQAAARRSAAEVAAERADLASGAAVRHAAWVDGAPVCTGRYAMIGGVAEIVGVGTLPAYRRRGLAAAVTAALAGDAVERGADIVFMSAGDDDVARLYRRLGFADVATACIAAPAKTGRH